MAIVYEYFLSCWWTLLQMAPALLAGFLAAGIISAFMSEAFIRRHLGGKGFAPIAKAALLGVPMPLCSCGVLPVATALKRSGASRGAIVAFLISVPQTGADNIFVVWSMLGLAFAIYSPLSAFLSGLFGGVICEYFGGRKMHDESGAATLGIEKPERKLMPILKYSFLTLVDDIAGALLLGIAIAGIVTVAIPDGWISTHLGKGLGPMLLMLLAGIPIYVCSSGSVPIAAAFMEKGASAGAALVFLITGPASNAAGIAAISKMLGLRCAILFLVSLVIFAFGSGMMLNLIYETLPASAVQVHTHAHDRGGNTLFQLFCGVLLLALIMYSLLKSFYATKNKSFIKDGTLILQVTGMTCNHCAKSVKETLTALPGCGDVEVDLKSGRVYIEASGDCGDNTSVEMVKEAVEKLGFKCEQVMQK